jgi:hypothetical protein
MANQAAQELGKKGGQVKSAAKTEAARKNASKPRGKWFTAIAYELDGVEKYKAFGAVLVRGCPPAGALASHDWTCQKVREHGVGLRDVEELDFLQLATSSQRV